jgi:hypothetical protein
MQAMSSIQGKQLVISFSPDSPGTNHKNFHEEWSAKPLLGHEDSVMDNRVLIPKDSNSKPSSNRRRTIKEQMLHSFLNFILA